MSTRKHLESRTELMARVAEPFGHSKADREDHIALLLVQLQKDMAVVTAASMVAIAGLRSLKGINTIIGSKARINDLEETSSGALKQISVGGCEDILMLTKNKKCTHHQNLSSNPGFESFVGIWGGGRR